jgi:hypothetical protein
MIASLRHFLERACTIWRTAAISTVMSTRPHPVDGLPPAEDSPPEDRHSCLAIVVSPDRETTVARQL